MLSAVAPGDRYATAEELQLELEAFVRARKLDVSSTALASLMRTVFGEEPYPSVPAFARTETRTEVAPLAVLEADDASLAETVARPRRGSRGGWWALAVVAVLALSGAGAAMWPEGGDAARTPAEPDPVERPLAQPAAPASAPATEPEPSAPETADTKGPSHAPSSAAAPSDAPSDAPEATAPADAPAPAQAPSRTRSRRTTKAKKSTDRRRGPKGMYP